MMHMILSTEIYLAVVVVLAIVFCCFPTTQGVVVFEIQEGKIHHETSSSAAAAGPAAALKGGNYQECVSDLSKSFQYCNTSLSYNQRVCSLISILNLTEKIHLLTPDPTNPNDCYVKTSPIQRVGLGPYMWLTESNSQANSRCYGKKGGEQCATAFTGALGLASTFNRSLWYDKGDVISTEMRALYNSGGYRYDWDSDGGDGPVFLGVGLTGFGPNINIARDPRFGRTSELPGEDPYLNGQYAIHYVKGMQQIDSNGYYKMQAYLKHYTAYSREVNRGHDNYNISLFNLFDTFLPAYEAGMIEGGAFGVMCSYNAVNGRPSCANGFILKDIMRKRWKRPDAIVMTDCGAVRNILHEPVKAPSPELAAAWTIGNGTDVEAGTHIWYDHMVNATQLGLVDKNVIDAAVRRILLGMMKVGRFDDPNQVSWSSITSKSIGNAEHTKIRDDAARQSLVLLRNLGMVLPLQYSGTKKKKIVIVGPQANNGQGLLPDYYGDQVCPDSTPDCIPTFYEIICDINGQENTFVYSGVNETSTKRTHSYDETLSAVRTIADIVILAMGISKKSEREAVDRSMTGLPGLQNQFARDVLEIAKSRDIPAVLLLTNGGSLSIDDLIPRREYFDDIPQTYRSNVGIDPSKLPRQYAIVEAYNPSLGAKGIVEALFGIGPISFGRLVTTIYPKLWAETHPPDQYDMAAGDGLTYRYHTGDVIGTFGDGMPAEDPSKVQLNCSLLKEALPTINKKWKVVCQIRNLSKERSLSGLVLVFVRPSDEMRKIIPYPVPNRSLRGFNRTMIDPGQTGSIAIDINISDLMFVNNQGHLEAFPGRHFDLIDVWDGWNYFQSFQVSIADINDTSTSGGKQGVYQASYY